MKDACADKWRMKNGNTKCVARGIIQATTKTACREYWRVDVVAHVNTHICLDRNPTPRYQTALPFVTLMAV